jgi:predicted HAD superfamily Cof-like phosphohydrolase
LIAETEMNTELTNFNKVKEFNTIFGVEREKEFIPETFNNEALVRLRMDLIREEMRELEDAVRDRDRKETVDALADILYGVYGMGDCLGVDLDKAFDIVHSSNMSKLADTEEQARASVELYRLEGKYDTPSYRPIETPRGLKYLIFNVSSGKVLKNKDYIPANFDVLFGNGDGNGGNNKEVDKNANID